MSVSHIKIANLRHFTLVHFSLPFPLRLPRPQTQRVSRRRGKCKRDGKSDIRLRFFRPESPIALGTSPLGPSSGVHLLVLLYLLLIILFNSFKYAQSLGCLPSSHSPSPLPRTPQSTSPSVHTRVFELCVQRRPPNTHQVFSPQPFKFTPPPRPCISDWFLPTQPLPYTSHCPSHTTPHISLYLQLGPFPLRDWLTMIWKFQTPSTFLTSQPGSSPCSTRSSSTSPR